MPAWLNNSSPNRRFSSSSFPLSPRSPNGTYIPLEDRPDARGGFFSAAAGSQQQKSGPFEPGKSLRSPLEHKLALFWWLVFVGLTTASWWLFYNFPAPTDAVEHGSKTTVNGTRGDPKSPGTAHGMYLFLVNIATTLAAVIVSYFRTGLLAPSPHAYRESKGRLYLGVDSDRGFRDASWPRKFMFLVLLGASLPLYFFLVFTKYPAYNAYEVVVSTAFFDGKPFDLAGINMTRFASLRETPTMPSPDLRWPAEYGASDQLNSSLAKLQREPTVWKNLSRAECVEDFNDALYTKYRTLVMVTDNASYSDSSNSALAITVLPGYRLKSASFSLIAVCPDTYLETYNKTINPPETPFLELKWQGASTTDMEFLSLDEAHQWAINGSLSGGASASSRKRHAPMLGEEVARSNPYNPMPCQDICYHCWTDDGRWMSEHPRIYRVPQCRLDYCLAEPVTAPRMCQVVYRPRVLFILSVFLSCLLAVITVALVLRWTRQGLYSIEDAGEYFRHANQADCPRWREEFYGDHHSGERALSRCRMPWHLAALSLLVFIYVWVLYGDTGSAGENVKYPSGPEDDSRLFKAIALHQALHIIFVFQHYFQDADVNKRAFRVRFNKEYERAAAGRGFWKKAGSAMPSFIRGQLLGMRSFLVHFTFGLVFITQLMGVAQLEDAAGTLAGSKPFALTTFGLTGFNQRLLNFGFGFFFFNWLVFVALPSSLLDLIFYATTSFSVEKKERVMTPFTLVSVGIFKWLRKHLCCRD